MQKKIEHILEGRDKKITEEETVKQSLPHKDFRFANPFIVVHHILPETIQPGQQLRIQPHPHRGFAPVTFLLQGQGYHKDSAGHDEIINAGDVQWMFAGKGILHSEGPSEQLLRQGGVHELVQLWINVPARYKWDEPYYQHASKDQLPPVLLQEGVHLRLASGEYEGKTGPLKTHTPVLSIVGEVEKDKSVQFTVKEGYWTLLYLVKGAVTVNGVAVAPYHLVVFEKDNDGISVTANEVTQLLLLSAEPIDEPVAAKGNFVMNTAEEIEQAIADEAKGLYGTLSS
jgi:redox-sensitive bicupin YhaK (pirin superfamily)